MSGKRILIGVVVLGAALLAGWYWYSRPRDLWGGIRPYMDDLYKRQRGIVEQLGTPGPLPEDFRDMEQIVQMAQDVFPVFRKDPRYTDPRFTKCATELTRQAKFLEYTWDNKPRDVAVKTFADFTAACNNCHQQLAAGRAPTITAPAPPAK